MTDEDSLDIYGSLDGFREVGRSMPGTDLMIHKTDPKEDDGKIVIIQVKFATEEGIPSWGTTKTHKKPQKR